jgi:hypothetical protein
MQEVYLYKKPGSARVAGDNTMQRRNARRLREPGMLHRKQFT